MSTTGESGIPTLPVYLVNWDRPRQQRDAQQAAAAVGTGNLVQVLTKTLTESHALTGTAELGTFMPRVLISVVDALENVELTRVEASWDRVHLVGRLSYSLDHSSWPERVYFSVPLKFCPGCRGRGGAHAEGCWGSEQPALPLV